MSHDGHDDSASPWVTLLWHQNRSATHALASAQASRLDLLQVSVHMRSLSGLRTPLLARVRAMQHGRTAGVRTYAMLSAADATATALPGLRMVIR